MFAVDLVKKRAMILVNGSVPLTEKVNETKEGS